MLNRVVNGYTIVAVEKPFSSEMYVILGMRRDEAGFKYVTGRMVNFDHDPEWYWGNYFTEFSGAVEDYHKRLENGLVSRP